MFKKIFAMFLAVAIVFALCACGSSGEAGTPAQNPTQPDAPQTSDALPAIDYPTRTVTVIVPFGAGGDTDLAARIITDKLSKILDCTIVVENVSGGSGVIGHTQMLASDADGYTLMINQLGSHVTQTQLGNTTYAMMIPPLSPVWALSPSALYSPLTRNGIPSRTWSTGLLPTPVS